MENLDYLCVMFSLIEHIEYSMMTHDCVIIPGWGALIAQYSDSFFNEDAGIINKPQRKVGFNSSVNHNDGLLAQSIVRREGITYDEAVRFIADSVTTFKQQLNDAGEVSLGRLGFFHNNDGLVDFIPFFHESCNDEYFGLRSVNFKTLEQLRKEQEQLQEGESVHETIIVAQRHWARRAMQIAASIIVLLALVPVLTTPVVSIKGHDQASLNLPSVKAPQRQIFNWDTASVNLTIALPQAEVKDSIARAQAKASELKRQQKLEELAKKQKENQALAALDNASGNGKYYLIISSLSNEKQVCEFLGSHDDMKGKMQVLKRGNKFRIYVARDNNANNLYKIKSSLPERYHDAWVCD